MLMAAVALSSVLLWASAWPGEGPSKGEAKAEKKDAEPEEFLKKMQRKVSFEFVDTPLAEGVSFLRSLTNVNIIVDPKLMEEAGGISLMATDTPVRTALDQMAQAVGARAYYRDGGYWISKNPPADEKPASKPVPVPALTEEQRKLAAQAIAELGNEDYEAREAAGEKLRKLGPAVVPLLEESLKAENKDAERQTRLTRLVEDLKLGGDLDAQLAQALQRRVSFEFVDTPLSEAMTFLGSLTTRAKFSVDPDLDGIQINLRVTDMKMDLALEWIARLAEAKVVKSGNTVKLVKKQ
jgi:type II secretory pathway component GspD/PulD (secretin)